MKTLTEPEIEHDKTLKRSRVLVVDDEEQNRTLLKDPLEARGFEVAEAESGTAALEYVLRSPPDVILLDVMMPVMDGFTVCRLLKADPRTAAVPILMVTALSERRERLMGIEAGATDFLNKPVDVQDLLLRVSNAAHSKALFDELTVEREKSERLLRRILPGPIADRIKAGEVTIADKFGQASVLVADLAGFTTLASHIPPEELVFLLNEIFTGFDNLLEVRGLEKIKTMGDAYMAAAGLPTPREDHAEAVADLALAMVNELEDFNRQYQTSLRLRIGISTGAVVAGVIGRQKFTYDVWGDAVNIACRLESLGRPGTILVDDNTFQALKNDFEFGNPQTVDLKGRGKMLVHELRQRSG